MTVSVRKYSEIIVFFEKALSKTDSDDAWTNTGMPGFKD